MAKTLVYQMYPLSWKGGLPEMQEHLQKVAALGADYVWLSPIYPSPLHDHGYDVSDYKAISSRFGTMQDFDGFVTAAHDLGIGVLMDLVLNHTSTSHKWFDTHPEYYCWSKYDREGWHNLFDGGPAWQYVEGYKEYYLHLFTRYQADLNWFPDGELNHALVREFREIVDFWTEEHCVDGFRLDVPQTINKDFGADELELANLLYGGKAVDVLNAVFEDKDDLFLIMECFDPSFGELVEYYAANTPVNFVMDVLLKDEGTDEPLGGSRFSSTLGLLARNPQFMVDLESHDAPRFLSRQVEPYCDFSRVTSLLFNSSAEGICVYQGQELGLRNPTKEELPDDLMLELDAQTAMQFIRGEDLDDLRPTSRANSRVPLPLDEYQRQEADPASHLWEFRAAVEAWK